MPSGPAGSSGTNLWRTHAGASGERLEGETNANSRAHDVLQIAVGDAELAARLNGAAEGFA